MGDLQESVGKIILKITIDRPFLSPSIHVYLNISALTSPFFYARMRWKEEGEATRRRIPAAFF